MAGSHVAVHGDDGVFDLGLHARLSICGKRRRLIRLELDNLRLGGLDGELRVRVSPRSSGCMRKREDLRHC